MGKHDRLTGTERVARRRAALEAMGLRPKQFWVPDLHDETVRAEIADACRQIVASPGYADDLAFIEAVRYWPPDDPA